MDIGVLWLLAGLAMLIWLVLILSVAWLATTRPGRHPSVPNARARKILADRYSRGEIDFEEYRQRVGIPREELSHR
jgi:putative membrane protein